MPDTLPKRTTILDIARAAGVSKTTVSRFLNGKYEYMSSQTRERIQTVISLSNYRPSNIARSLKNQRSMLVGVAIADIQNPFSASLIRGIGDILMPQDYVPVFMNSENALSREQELIESLVARGVDGLIVNTVSCQNPFIIETACKGVPVVLCDRQVADYTFDIAYAECKAILSTVVRHLYEQGFWPITLFTQPYETISPRKLRVEGFTQTMRAIGCKDPQAYIYLIDDLQENTAIEQTKRLMQQKVPGKTPAVIAGNSVMLIQVLLAVRRMGLCMPQDIGVCGPDDWDWGEHMNWSEIIQPGITTFTVPAYEVGAATARVLLKRLKNPQEPKQSVVIPSSLQIRASTLLQNP